MSTAVLAHHVQVIFQGQPEGFDHVDVVRLHAPETAVLDLPDLVIHTAGHIGELASRDGVRGWRIRKDVEEPRDALHGLVVPAPAKLVLKSRGLADGGGCGRHCGSLAAGTDFGLGADRLVALGFDAPDGVLRDQHGAGKDGFGRIVRLGYQVAARLADGGEDFFANSVLKLHGPWKIGPHYEAVYVRLGDNLHWGSRG